MNDLLTIIILIQFRTVHTQSRKHHDTTVIVRHLIAGQLFHCCFQIQILRKCISRLPFLMIVETDIHKLPVTIGTGTVSGNDLIHHTLASCLYI